jgi:nucleotide-binding universal stress UspA family protein
MRIIVPVDGSAPACRALAHAASIARERADAEIILLNVQNRDTLDLSEISAVMSSDFERTEAERQSKEILDRSAKFCRKTGAAFETRAAFGPVAETIARVIRELRCDQVVMGTRGLSGLRGALLGSIATKVIRLSRVPVTLVK